MFGFDVTFFHYGPRILGALLLLIIGWVLAEIARKFSRRLLKRAGLDELSEKVGLEGFLIESGIRQNATGLAALTFYWFILFSFILAAIYTLGMDAAGDLFVEFATYLPRVIIAMIIIFLGVFLARLARSTSFAYLNKIQAQGAQLMSLIAYIAILVFSISLALESLGVGGPILTSAFQIVFGSICLAFAIAFGLGGRHWASGIIEKVLKK